MALPSLKIAVAANSLWYIANFRDGLVAALQERGFTPILVAPPDAASAAKFGDGVQIEAVPMVRSGTDPLAEIKVLALFRRVFEASSCAALVSFTIKPNIYGALAARSLNIPVIPTITGLGTVFIKGGWLQSLVERMYRFAFARTSVVFFENRSDLDLFVSREIVRKSQCRLVPGCGVNLDRFAFTPLPDGPPVFLMIARVLADKGVREFVAAARQARASGLVGRFQLLGPLDEANRSAISEAELSAFTDDGSIEYLGAADDVRPFIAKASAVVLPSYREGLPRTLLEGAAMGRPLIATDVPGCRDVVEEGANGFLCAPRDAASLAAAMVRFSELDAARQAAMGDAGRRMVENRFSEDTVVAAYLDAICEVLDGRPVAIDR